MCASLLVAALLLPLRPRLVSTPWTEFASVRFRPPYCDLARFVALSRFRIWSVQNGSSALFLPMRHFPNESTSPAAVFPHACCIPISMLFSMLSGHNYVLLICLGMSACLS